MFLTETIADKISDYLENIGLPSGAATIIFVLAIITIVFSFASIYKAPFHFTIFLMTVLIAGFAVFEFIPMWVAFIFAVILFLVGYNMFGSLGGSRNE